MRTHVLRRCHNYIGHNYIAAGHLGRVDAITISQQVIWVASMPWRVLCHPRGNNNDKQYLSLYLEAYDLLHPMPSGWERVTAYRLLPPVV